MFPLIYQEVRPGGFDHGFRKGVFESDGKSKLGKLDLLSPAELLGERETNVWKAGAQPCALTSPLEGHC